MYFGVGRSGKGYSSLSLSLSTQTHTHTHTRTHTYTHTHTHTHTHTVGERKNVKFLTVVVRKCGEIFFYENKHGGSLNAN